VVYRGQDILLWSLESYALHDTYNRNGSSSRIQSRGDDAGALCLAFSMAPDANLLAVGYAYGDLLLFDTADGVVKQRRWLMRKPLLARQTDVHWLVGTHLVQFSCSTSRR
jgi:hypothetical protein